MAASAEGAALSPQAASPSEAVRTAERIRGVRMENSINQTGVIADGRLVARLRLSLLDVAASHLIITVNRE
ncbi:hypothetical protein D3C73_1510970 [compost metagenome]